MFKSDPRLFNNSLYTGTIIAKKFILESDPLERKNLITKALYQRDKELLKGISEQFTDKANGLESGKKLVISVTTKLLGCSEETTNKMLGKFAGLHLENENYKFNEKDFELVINRPEQFCKFALELVKVVKEQILLNERITEANSLIENKILEDTLDRKKSFCSIV